MDNRQQKKTPQECVNIVAHKENKEKTGEIGDGNNVLMMHAEKENPTKRETSKQESHAVPPAKIME